MHYLICLFKNFSSRRVSKKIVMENFEAKGLQKSPLKIARFLKLKIHCLMSGN
jgi:hypothetical protein